MSVRRIEAVLTPWEAETRVAQAGTDHRVCVVFDILRATSTIVTALAHGAESVIPVCEIREAIAIRARRPEVILAGERGGVRIGPGAGSEVEFDLGNSPREFTPARVAGKTIVLTTTNGTRALRASALAGETWVGAFLNLRAVVDRLLAAQPEHLLLVCSGTGEEAAAEDTLAAGALCEAVWPAYEAAQLADSAWRALRFHRLMRANPMLVLSSSRNGARLMGDPDLREDVAFCSRCDLFPLVPVLNSDGEIRKAAAPDAGAVGQGTTARSPGADAV